MKKVLIYMTCIAAFVGLPVAVPAMPVRFVEEDGIEGTVV